MRLWAVLVFWLLAAGPVQAQPTTTSPVSAKKASATSPEIRLADNVFVVPDKYAKSVTGWVLIRAGCADETPTCEGTAHFLEHLQFINRDSDHRSKVELFPAGNGNGWTSMTATGYTQSFPLKEATRAQDLDKLVGYLAALLEDVRATPAQAERERNVVLQEHFQRLGNSATARFGQKRTALLLPDDPLGRSIGGTPDLIKAYDIPRASAFQKNWYAVSNASFVFSGPVNGDELKPLVAKYIAPLVPRAVPPRPWLKVAPPAVTRLQLNERDKDAKQISVTFDKLVTYLEPEGVDDQLTLNAARSVVASFFSSRLSGSPLDAMIEKNELIAQGGFSVQRVRPGLMRLSFSGTPSPGVTPERLLGAVRRYVDGLKPDLITAAYLERLKKRAAVGRQLLQDEPSRYASGLVGWLQGQYSYDAWRTRDTVDDRLRVSQVNQILTTLAKPGREVSGILSPTEPTVSASKQ